MATTKLGDLVVSTNGEIPKVGSSAPDFKLTDNNLGDVTLKQFRGKNVILNIFPSIDTSTCATSVRTFNQRAAGLQDTVVLCIARDLPFAMKRFCGAEGIANVTTASDFRSPEFSRDYGVLMTNGRMSGLFARVIVVVDKEGKVKHTEVTETIGQEPNYESALASLK